MIPSNDAIWVAVIASVLIALIVTWATRGYWRARVRQSYQEGHAAGICTQISRYQKALDGGPRSLFDQWYHLYGAQLADYTWQGRALQGFMAGWNSRGDDYTMTVSPPLDFPGDLPAALREFAEKTMTRSDAQNWSLLP